MKILFIGDVVGQSGRKALADHLPALKAKHKPDFTIVNGENAAHGFGITATIAQELLQCGADVLTTGNHTWSQKEFSEEIQTQPRVLRPYNWPEGTPGMGQRMLTDDKSRRLLVVNMIGRLYMLDTDCPFKAVDRLLETFKISRDCDAIFIDFHAEATSEKQAFAYYCDGRVSAVIGTHTHVPTSDYRVLPCGAAYMSDVGMTGDYQTVIGNSVSAAIARFTAPWKRERLEPGAGEGTVSGCVIDLNQDGKAKAIKPIFAGKPLSR